MTSNFVKKKIEIKSIFYNNVFLKDTISLTIYPFPTFSVNVYLGLNVEILQSQSWYSFLHPQDLSHASAQHRNLCESHS